MHLQLCVIVNELIWWCKRKPQLIIVLGLTWWDEVRITSCTASLNEADLTSSFLMCHPPNEATKNILRIPNGGQIQQSVSISFLIVFLLPWDAIRALSWSNMSSLTLIRYTLCNSTIFESRGAEWRRMRLKVFENDSSSRRYAFKSGNCSKTFAWCSLKDLFWKTTWMSFP